MRWHFHDDTITWGNQVLASVSGADLVIIDELGPLELTHGRGLTAGLALLDAQQHPAVVVIIRPELVPQAQQRWPNAEVFTVPAWGARDIGTAARQGDPMPNGGRLGQ